MATLTRRVLLGTTNPSKISRFKTLLVGKEIEFLTLSDFSSANEPIEIGKTPEENAVIKAKHYSKYLDIVICNDSGLYFDKLSISDPRQPGLNIRTPHGGQRLSDEEMIKYYSDLIASLGGKVLAYYLDGYAVFNRGKIYSFMNTAHDVIDRAFYMTSSPSAKRHIGWPLDSISINKFTGKYFTDSSVNDIAVDEKGIFRSHNAKLKEFLVSAICN